MEKKCDACGKLNHFARVCKSKDHGNRYRPTPYRGSREVRYTSNDTGSEASSSSEEESGEFIHAVRSRTKMDLQRQKIAKRNYTQCGYCGRNQVHARKEHCIAYGKRCYYCNKWHHIAKVCKSAENDHNENTVPGKSNMQRRGTRQRRINDFSSSDESDHSLSRSSLTRSVQHISKCYDLIGNGFTVDAFQGTGVNS